MGTQTELKWKLAKISKHGYTNFEKRQDCTDAILFVRNNGVKLTPNEYYQDVETKQYIIEPNKTNAKKIAKVVEKQFGIKPY